MIGSLILKVMVELSLGRCFRWCPCCCRKEVVFKPKLSSKKVRKSMKNFQCMNIDCRKRFTRYELGLK